MLKTFQKKMNKKGFSLIELIVVIAIIGIMVMMAAPRFLGYTKDADVAAMKSDVKILSDAALLYHIDNEAFPTTGATVVLTDAADAKLIAALGFTDAADVAADVAAGTFNILAIDGTKLTSYVKGISGEYADYLLITAGANEGDVVHKAGVEAKDGTIWFGTKLSD